MTAKDFGRLAEIMVKKPKWTLADRDAVVVALREAEKRLLGAGQVMRGSHVYNSQMVLSEGIRPGSHRHRGVRSVLQHVL